MSKTFQNITLISFGAILALSLNILVDLWRHNQTIQETLIQENEAARENLNAGTNRFSNGAFFLAAAMSAWQVEVYSQEEQAFLNWPKDATSANWKAPSHDKTTKLLGRFMHTGSWVDMAEYRKHQGIFVATPVSITMRGYIFSESDDDFVFAVHFDNRAAQRFSRNKYAKDKTAWIRCNATLKINETKAVIRDFTRFDARTANAELRAVQSISLSGSGWHLVEASVSCSLPRNVDAADISFRLCARRSSEGGFSPLRPVMPLSNVHKVQPFNYIGSQINTENAMRRP
ncbi:MAG: hypothetical protein JKY20_06025 [Alphaproteobacteria bacterium]|nr:hypothetical protein [Alphaproteobacteria bacterium]